MRDSPENLLRLLAEWLRLTEQQNAAVHSEDWVAVGRQQAAKSQLCPGITEALGQVRGEPPAESIASLAAQIIALETQCRDLLHTKRRAKQAELAHLQETTRHLQGVRRAYGPASQHFWQSYS